MKKQKSTDHPDGLMGWFYTRLLQNLGFIQIFEQRLDSNPKQLSECSVKMCLMGKLGHKGEFEYLSSICSNNVEFTDSEELTRPDQSHSKAFWDVEHVRQHRRILSEEVGAFIRSKGNPSQQYHPKATDRRNMGQPSSHMMKVFPLNLTRLRPSQGLMYSCSVEPMHTADLERRTDRTWEQIHWFTYLFTLFSFYCERAVCKCRYGHVCFTLKQIQTSVFVFMYLF